MITYKRYFARYCSLYEYGLSVFDSRWFPGISLYFPLYPCLLVEKQKHSTFVSSDLTEYPMRKGGLFISKRRNYDNKWITGQACLADDWWRITFPCTTW